MAADPAEIERASLSAINDFHAGRLERATASCQRLLKRDPSNLAAHQLLAITLLQGGDIRAARDHIGRSLAARRITSPLYW
jgi:Flp pilus assembly protein TadD